MNRNLPNFLVLGAAKSGTTSLDQYLKQHPQIYMSPMKEPSFFAGDVISGNYSIVGAAGRWWLKTRIRDFESYCVLFREVKNEIAIGEISPMYLISSKAAKTIRDYIPDAKVIAVLRNPVDRTYSQYCFNLQSGSEHILDFERAINQENYRIANNAFCGFFYVNNSMYYTQLKRYFDIFDKNQIRVYLYEDFCMNTIDVLRSIFRFTGVDDTFVPNVSERHNVTGIPSRFWCSLNRYKTILRACVPLGLRRFVYNNFIYPHLSKPSPLPTVMRTKLIELFREDILKLQDLINKDLSKWLE